MALSLVSKTQINMKRPLFAVASLFMGGILLGHWFQPSLTDLFAAAFLCALTALFWPRARIFFLAVVLVLAGWTNLVCHTAIISPNDLRSLPEPWPKDACVRGILQASPVSRIFERQGHELWRSTVVIDAEQIRLAGVWQPAFGKVIATVPGILSSNFFSGQTVAVAGVLGPPHGPLAEGLFDARSHYEHQGIYYLLGTSSLNDWSTDKEDVSRPFPLQDRFSAWAKKTLALGLGQEDAPLRLVWTLALDWKAPLTEAVEEPFMKAGTYHIFAVDGLRIGLLAMIGIVLLRVLHWPRALSGFLVIPAIWGYAALTGWPASAIRAAIMMTIVIVGWASRRPADLVNSLFAAALIILAWEPAQLFQPGFQLSFVVVLCIALLLPLIQNAFKAIVSRKDPFLPGALQPRWPAPLYAATGYAFDTAAMSLAAFLGSMPLAAAYFHLFTPVGILANLVVVPITALALMSSIGSLFTGAWIPAAAVLFNHASWFFMKCIITFSLWASQCPYGSFNVSTPRPVTFILYYLVLFSVLTGWLFRPKIKWPVVIVILALGVCWLAPRMTESKIAHLHCLPLNGGAALFADNAGAGQSQLFDCGNAHAVESVIKPFLRAQGVNSLDAFALTVAHVQDGGGAEALLTNFPARRVFINAIRGRSSSYRQTIDAVKRNAGCQPLQAGDDAQGWSVLHPGANTRLGDADDNALVFRREINGHAILLLSALARKGQDSLTARQPDLRAEIVIASLPAQDEPLCEPLLQSIQPRLIIIVDSEFPATRRASAKLRERLAAHHVPVLYCHDTGALKLSLWPGGWNVKDADDQTLREN